MSARLVGAFRFSGYALDTRFQELKAHGFHASQCPVEYIAPYTSGLQLALAGGKEVSIWRRKGVEGDGLSSSQSHHSKDVSKSYQWVGTQYHPSFASYGWRN
jgi:hypothetical protein